MNANKFIFLENYQGVSYALECTKINDPSQSLLEPKSTTWSWSSRYFKTGHVIMIKLHENFDFLGAVYMISECLSCRNEFYSSMKFVLHSHDEIKRLSQRRSGQSRSQRPQSFWSATGMLVGTSERWMRVTKDLGTRQRSGSSGFRTRSDTLAPLAPDYKSSDFQPGMKFVFSLHE